MPKKDKKLKPKKIKAVRAPRAPRVPRAKSTQTHIINVYTTPSTAPFEQTFSPFTTTSTQYIQPQTLKGTNGSSLTPPLGMGFKGNDEFFLPEIKKELTSKSVFQVPFSASLTEPMKKLKIGEVINLETSSDADTSVVEKKTRGPYKSKGKGSTIEKHQNIGKNIQNEFVKMVEGYNTDAAMKDVNTATAPMQFYTQGGKI